MKILDVYIEHGKASLDRPFSYLYDGEKDVQPFFRVIVDFHGQKIMGFVAKVHESEASKEQLEEANGFSLNFVEEVIDSEPLLNDELKLLAKEVSSYYLSPYISVLQSMLPRSLRPSISALHGPKIAYEKWVRLLDPSEEGLTSEKQIELLRLIAKNKEVLKKDLGSLSAANKLISLKKIEEFKKEKERFHLEEYEKEQPRILTIAQQNALEQILLSHKEVSLLEGVTGSGKTEVYLALSEKYLSAGKNVLMLVPEISLTPIMVEYFSRRFQNNVAILHSGLTPAEKYDEYRKIAQGKAHIVIGARSAVFAPLSNIGLIILDEEHVESYKSDQIPCYHAREVAIMRGKHFGAKVVLGSATPSLESRARAIKGVYEHILLPKRINEKALPKTTIVDLRKPGTAYPGGYDIFSKTLVQKIKEKLDKKEQVVLLINRRGYSPYVGCHDCGYVYTCPNCHSFLSYHRDDDMLKCHHCDFVMRYPESCPECGSKKIKRTGYGTERILKKLGEIFPSARICRLDSDIGKVHGNVHKTLEEFRHQEYDILVGTQMIAKGHDFPLVTLVGVVQADLGLYNPSYRSGENTFELLTQAVGRAGRSQKEGEAIIQTYNPGHYAISYGAKQDYQGFYLKEMETRKIGRLPPYVFMISIRLSGKDEDKVAEAAYQIKQAIEEEHFENVALIGPSTPYIAFLGGKYRRNILVKFKSREKIVPYLEDLAHRLSGRAGVDIGFDVDPLEG